MSSDSEDDRERRRRKEKKSKKHKEKEKDRDGRKKHRREKSYDDSEDDSDHDRRRRRREKSYDESEEDRDRRHRRRRSHRSGDSHDDDERSRSLRRTRSPHSSRAHSPPRSQNGDEDEWVEKQTESFVAKAEHTGATPQPPHQTSRTSSDAVKGRQQDDDDDGEEVGPQPPEKESTSNKKVDERAYGGALLRGEGSAMAAFLQDGTQSRIPRRGEIGLTSDEIAQYEQVGYVMSGSRHRRMNAVRMRKENQVISAEEKRGILKLQKEERERREAILREEFKELVEDKLKGAAGPSKT